MNRNQEIILDEALRCFYPRLEDTLRPEAVAALKELADDYRVTVENGVQAFPPVRKLIDGVFESPDAYQARCQETQFPSGPRGKGRPRSFAADVLVYFCREMLIKFGCNSSAPRRSHDAPSNLEKLAILVHELAGLSPRKGWRQRAEDASDAVWRLQLILGKVGFPATGATPDLKRMLNRSEVRPPKRKN